MYLTQPLHRALQQHPDRVALICGTRQKSFRTLAERVARLAGALRQNGMKDGDRVAMLALNSDRYFEYMLAVPWGGGALNPCNTRWSAAEILFSLADAGSEILLVDDHFLSLASELTATGQIKTLIYAGEGEVPVGMLDYEQLIAASDPVPDAVRRGDDLLGLFYTGGTTGSPKGVMLGHGGFMTCCLAVIAGGMAAPGGVFLHAAPMFHLADVALGCANWVLGNTHVFIPSFSPPAVVNAIVRDKVSDVLLVPTMIQMLVDHPVMREGRNLGALRSIAYGGSSISEAVIERALAALPGVQFYQAYGMTELSPVASILGPEYHSDEGRALGKLRSGGRAHLCSQIRIVDPEDRDLPAGATGEIIVRGPHVMQGYWNRPEETAAAIRGGWMHTGDCGYLDADGFVFVVDRVKDMIISGGENIYSAEVENALCQHVSVRTCAVIGIPSERWGESVHAFVILKQGEAATAEELILHCKALIAGYKCPRTIEFVDQLPLSGPGKILKTELRKRFWEGRDKQVA
jgi:long-chain acyl-CoA synthetase